MVISAFQNSVHWLESQLLYWRKANTQHKNNNTFACKHTNCLVALHNNRVVDARQAETVLIGAHIPDTPAGIGEVLARGAPAAVEAFAGAGGVVAGTTLGALDVALVAEVPTLGITYSSIQIIHQNIIL